jgi:hypothetical protein
MKPPGKTTLTRMQLAAMREAERIEISQDARVSAGLLDAPMPCQVLLRDDFAGIVRLLDVIQSDRLVLERVVELMKTRPATLEQAHGAVANSAEVSAEALPAADEEVEAAAE